MQEIKTSPKVIRELFFWSGIIATVCYRAIVILNHYSQTVALAAWYVGTIGFIVYFWHRYVISEKRAELIRDHDLIRAVAQSKDLTDDQKAANEYILTALLSTKEKWNYIVIFATSVAAILVGLYLDFLSH
jgi:hypothetical protein